MLITNKLTIDGSTRIKTSEGFLRATALAAKAGVQKYLATEIGVAPVDDSGVVSVARLPIDVFSTDSLATWTGIDLTNNHPKGGVVTVDNYKREAVGHVLGDATASNSHVVIDILVKDKEAIKAIESGKAQVSAGYTADYEPLEGELDGVPYNYVQRNIKVNHLAIVNKGRAKSALILDEDTLHMEKLAELEATVATLTVDNQTLTTEVGTLTTQLGVYKEVEQKLVMEQVTADALVINPEGVYANLSVEDIKRTALAGTITSDHSLEVVDFAFTQALVAPVKKVTTDDESLDVDKDKDASPEKTHKKVVITTDKESDSRKDYVDTRFNQFKS
jgi:hypothetical protein